MARTETASGSVPSASVASPNPLLLHVPRASSWVRALGWDQLLRIAAGGVGVTGEAPKGPAIVVANHGSHADTAALIAVLGRHAPVLVVAGGDYWKGWRYRLGRNIVGILPIDRAGGFPELLREAGEHLRSGGVVVIFPEGTRSRDGVIGRFHTGAARLAAEVGVPIVPVALHGTCELYGKGRRLPDLTSVRHHQLAATIGQPLLIPHDADATDVSNRLRETIIELRQKPIADVTNSATWEWAQTRLAGRGGAAFTFCWAFIEGLFFPIVAEAGVLPATLAHGRGSLPAIGAAAAGSTAGVVTNWALSRAGIKVPWPLTTPDMHEAARNQLRSNASQAFSEQRGNGIPVKVYARAAGEMGAPLLKVVPAAALSRSSRIIPIGLASAAIGEVAKNRLRVSYGAALAGSAIGLAVGLELVIRSWKKYR